MSTGPAESVPTPIRILIVEDQRVFAEALRVVLGLEPDLQVVGVVTGLQGLPLLVRQHQPHVLLLDVHLPDGDGLMVARSLLEVFPGLRIIVLSVDDALATVRRAAAAGVSGYLTKDRALADVVAAVRRAARGESLFTPAEVAALVRADLSPGETVDFGLTPRERDVLAGLATGLDTETLSQRLNISPLTLRTHINRILRKLDAHTRLEAVLKAQRAGLI